MPGESHGQDYIQTERKHTTTVEHEHDGILYTGRATYISLNFHFTLMHLFSSVAPVAEWVQGLLECQCST